MNKTLLPTGRIIPLRLALLVLGWAAISTPSTGQSRADAQATEANASQQNAKNAAAVPHSNWALARSDAGWTGAVDTQLPPDLKVQWEFKAAEAIESTPIVVGDKVFFGDVFGRLYAIDRKTGKEVWQKNYDTGFLASPAVDSDTLVVGDVEGNVYALHVQDGQEVWKANTDGEIAGAVNFYRDTVLATSQDGKLYCYETKSGKVKWTYQTDDQIRCSPAIAGDRTFLGGCDGQLHVVDLKTGKAAGDPLPLGGPTGSTPAISGDNAFLPIMDGAVMRFDWKQHKEEWSHEDPDRAQEYRCSAAVKGDLVVVSSQYKQVDAISIKTGERVWRHTLRRRADASPVIAGDEVWIAATDGRLIRMNLSDGKDTWQYEIKGSFVAGPAIAGDQLFIADDEGIVRCFAAASDEAESK